MKRKTLIIILLVFVAGAVALYLWFRNHGFSAREEPSWVEARLARHARRIATPAGAKDLKNPVDLTEENLKEAREHFVEHCSLCHGVTGRGDTPLGRNLYPKAPDMTDADTQQLADGELFYIISNGIRFTGMPAWGGEDSPESIWGLVAFIRRLPQLSPDEINLLQEMAADAGDHKEDEKGLQQPTQVPKMKGKEDKKDETGERKESRPASPSRRKSLRPHAH